MAIVSDYFESNLKMASSIQAMVRKNGSSEMFLNFMINPGGDFCTILNKMKDNKFRAVVLFAQPALSSTFLNKAKLHGLVNLECTWIVGVMQGAGDDDFSAGFPSEIIQLKFSGRRNTSASFDNLMEDSIGLFRNALTYLSKTNVSSKDLLKSGCNDDEEKFNKNVYK